MRTTVTLDPDVESLIKRLMSAQGIGFKEALNAAVRRGLSTRPSPQFRQRTFPMGLRPEVDYDKALRIAGALEDEEVVRELATGR